MSETMIERVARALHIADHISGNGGTAADATPDALMTRLETSDPDHGKPEWTLFIADARAAIEAMRTLDSDQEDVMTEAFHATIKSQSDYSTKRFGKPNCFGAAPFIEAIHTAMINAALQSEPDSKGEVPG